MYAHAYLYIVYSGSQSKVVVRLNEHVGSSVEHLVVLRNTTATLTQQPGQTHKVLAQDALEGPLGIGLAVSGCLAALQTWSKLA